MGRLLAPVFGVPERLISRHAISAYLRQAIDLRSSTLANRCTSASALWPYYGDFWHFWPFRAHHAALMKTLRHRHLLAHLDAQGSHVGAVLYAANHVYIARSRDVVFNAYHAGMMTPVTSASGNPGHPSVRVRDSRLSGSAVFGSPIPRLSGFGRIRHLRSILPKSSAQTANASAAAGGPFSAI